MASYVQAADKSVQYTHGHAMAPVAGALAPPPDIDSADLLDPESLMGFFQLQMRDVQSQLGAMTQDQEARNKRVSQLQAFEAKLTAYQENGIKPGDPGWDDFVATAQQMKGLLGDTAAGQTIQQLIDKGTAPTSNIRTYQNKAEADAAAQAAGSQVSTIQMPSNVGSVTTYQVDTKDGPAAGLDKNDVQSIIQSAKAESDALNADSQMNMIRIQSIVDHSSQLINLCSNIMKKIDDSTMAPINNMR